MNCPLSIINSQFPVNSLLFGISISALLSTTSLLVVLLRVSPLTAPVQAIPALIITLFLSVSSIGALALLGVWKALPYTTWDTGRIVSLSLRQGILLGTATVVLVLFHLFGLLTWWIGLMIYGIFFLIELALDH